MCGAKYSFSILAGISFAALLGTSANAALSISDKATSNVTCDSGVCSATAKKAVLNVSDLTAMLAAGSVAVESGDQAQDITVDAPFSWTSSNALTLDAERSLTVNKAVSDAGPASLTLSYGKKGDLRFGPKDNISFTSTANSLTINGKHYTLVDSIASLAGAISNNPSGHYALAHNYDAGKKAYSSSPIKTDFTGTFEGLGNVISNLQINVVQPSAQQMVGLFSTLNENGMVLDFSIVNAVATVKRAKNQYSLGLLTGENEGTIKHVFASGAIRIGKNGAEGGLVGVNYGSIEGSQADVNIIGRNGGGMSGGLAGINADAGALERSFAIGNVDAGKLSFAGGLLGVNDGSVLNCYSMGSAAGAGAGGLIGQDSNSSSTTASYSLGAVSGSYEKGGLAGEDDASPGSFDNTYWDLDTSGIDDPSQGAGNVPNDPGITGLTDDQLKSSLPTGFDPKIWARDAKINNGYPYLRDNPPEK